MARGDSLDTTRSSALVSLNVGGQYFTTSTTTLMREPCSMLGLMFSSSLKTGTDEQGRLFIDRDPKHFRVILNYLRDGVCALPTEDADIQELLQEINFYQLSAMKSYVLGDDMPPLSAQHLRFCIVNRVQSDQLLQEALDLLIECAFGRGDHHSVPGRKACVEVTAKESAFNPLSPNSSTQAPDELLYVAFQQDLRFQGKLRRRFKFKHEPAFIHEEEKLSYDPAVYGGSYADRLHIKTMDVYRHHCIHQLSDEQRKLRDAALYIEANADAIQWGLELEGFKDVRLVFHARQAELCDALESQAVLSNPSSPTKQAQDRSPILCHISMDVHFSL